MSKGPVHISTKAIGAPMARAQNKTIASVWTGLKKQGVYFIADAVGRGKSYIALSVAIGRWRQQRKKKPVFRILIISPNNDLSGSWLKKLNGPFVPAKNRIGENLASLPDKDSFFDTYLPEMKSRNAPDVVVYRFKGKRCIENLSSDYGDKPNPVLRPRKQSRHSRIEILVTTPYWMKSGRGRDPFWWSWLKNADIVIADEVFGARNDDSIYGRILRPNDSKISPWSSNRKRPWLICLSATLLSRDIVDTWALIKLAYGWLDPSFDFSSNTVDGLLNHDDFHKLQQALKNGLDPSRSTHREDLKDYNRAKFALETGLRELLVRTPNQPDREYHFWPVGQATAGTSVEANRFPVSRKFDDVLKELQAQHWSCQEAKQNLIRFMRWTLETKNKKQSQQDARFFPAWSKITERGPDDLNDLHPKQDGFLKWFCDHYKKTENRWLTQRNPDRFSFKVLVYVHHRETAFDFRTHRARNQAEARLLGKRLNSTLKGLMKGTLSKIATEAKNKALFLNNDWRSPSRKLAEVMKDEGFAVDDLIERNLTLYLAACVNAHRSPANSKIESFRKTISGLEKIKRREKHFHALNTWPELRNHILKRLGLERIIDFDDKQARKRPKTRKVAVDILDPRHISNEKKRERFSTKVRSDLVMLQNLRLHVGKRDQSTIEGIFERVADAYDEAFKQDDAWQEYAAQRPSRILRQLELSSKLQAHNARAIKEVAVQTGDDSKSRSSITSRFLTPGNPKVLVLTNICTVGVDLHEYCWDVVHYTPSWTPHDLEQKTGRIDRPRNKKELMARFAIAPYEVAHKIRVHHLVWPFTYDERVLSRVHLRSQFSERLLSVKSQAAIEEHIADPGEVKIEEFKPLDLAPR
ncbi:MAG: hypothetical protein KF802_14725 [Bdellovibrionaceae bacterium]|nr:hypothetical protein [Pseudobdellovibrionaceae bacterium]